MKKLIFVSLAATLSFLVLAESDTADKDVTRTTYEYCLGLQDIDSLDLTELLGCINEEMDFMGYSKFVSVDEVKQLISEGDET